MYGVQAFTEHKAQKASDKCHTKCLMLQEQQLQAPILTAMSPGLNDSDPEVQSLTDSEAGEGYNEAPKQYICCIGQVKPLQLRMVQCSPVSCSSSSRVL